MKGRAHVYARPHINTDEIIPARYLNMDREKDLAVHVMEDIDTNFVKKVRAGDMIIAGEDFGCGSSREHAVWALRGAGIRAVIADSFARIFYRNAVNNGFAAVECPGISDSVSDGDLLILEPEAGEIINETRGTRIPFKPLPDFALEMLKNGGLLKSIASKVNNE